MSRLVLFCVVNFLSSALRGFKPDVVAYTSIIKGLCDAGSVEEAFKFFNEMLCQGPESQPDIVTYNILINALCNQGSVSQAIDLLNRMLDHGCNPSKGTCNIFLRALREKIDPPQDGTDFLDEMVARLVKRQRISGVNEIVEVMLRKFLSPKVSTWARVIQGLCKPKKIQAAIDKCKANLYG